MRDRFENRRPKLKEHILTEGGLQRTLKLGHPEQTMHLWWTGAFLARGLRAYVDPGGELAEADEFLIEIELIRIQGDSATIRIWAPERVKIISAKRDPHCQTAQGSEKAGCGPPLGP